MKIRQDLHQVGQRCAGFLQTVRHEFNQQARSKLPQRFHGAAQHAALVPVDVKLDEVDSGNVVSLDPVIKCDDLGTVGAGRNTHMCGVSCFWRMTERPAGVQVNARHVAALCRKHCLIG
ncbi:MAG: hypothetical protein AMJ72_05815 [Acidithiobacillales bacterium SM1_46]|nr:MAG: hypothetical protein AMJ72_05815 [Acidithiobacillales bacterium SM1_46]